MKSDKKHWIEFKATFYGAILVEGDETPEKAEQYVRTHLDIRCDAEGVDAEVNEHEVAILNSFEEIG